jgi:hypothetical protein
LRILVACERSGVVRDAFSRVGWEAWSCDLQETISPGNHYTGDVRDILFEKWDLVIAHPPCTYLTVTGNKWFLPQFESRFPTRKQDRIEAIEFFRIFTKLQCAYAIENPVGIMSRIWRKPNQMIQPFEYGHVEPKLTCLWLQGLPRLKPTKIVKPEYTYISGGKKRMGTWYIKANYAETSAERSNIRSQTFEGVANAMALQWGAHLTKRPADGGTFPVQQDLFSPEQLSATEQGSTPFPRR